MKISEIFRNKKQPISLEIFPPKGDLGADTLKAVVNEMKVLEPDYISVTYSAGGTGNSEKTAQLAGIVKNEYGIEAMAHLTCINSGIEEIDSVISAIKAQKIENVLALRGDRIADSQKPEFTYAKELINYLKDKGFCIGAACYPEGHIECEDINVSIDHLMEKQDSGADFFITQLFFDNEYFYNFIEKARSRGITKPVDAGIMPILGKAQISRMIFMCGSSLPSAIIKLLYKYENNPEGLRKAGIEYAAAQVEELLKNGADGIHIYTMNQPDIAKTMMGRVK